MRKSIGAAVPPMDSDKKTSAILQERKTDTMELQEKKKEPDRTENRYAE